MTYYLVAHLDSACVVAAELAARVPPRVAKPPTCGSRVLRSATGASTFARLGECAAAPGNAKGDDWAWGAPGEDSAA